MSIKIALAGNPNSGKTTLFNLLTGSNQYVGNWPGVTVEKKEGKFKSDKDIIITDLPGIYSLSPYTLEEVVTRNYLIDEKPNAIINIIDGTNLERNLYLTTQLIELSTPVIIAINMMDVVRKSGDIINTEELSRKLGCKIIEISAMKGTGITELTDEAIKLAKSGIDTEPRHTFSGSVEHALAHIEEACEGLLPKSEERWYTVKLFERDIKVIEKLKMDKDLCEHIERDIKSAEKELDDDSESIITNERYNYITSIINQCYKRKNENGLSASDKIDMIVTNRFAALPIFAVIMFVVYYVSISITGSLLTDFVNNKLFGEIITGNVQNLLVSLGTADWLTGLIINGIVGGVGAVLGFIPQIFVLFIFLAILEECGYMSRIAFVLDKIFRNFGLSGKSFIPMLIGTGCGVPGIMASRTIENENDRRMTIMTTTFMPCGAKLPIIALISSALLGGAWWVAPSAYFIGIVSIIVSGIILKKTKPFKGKPSPFVMEMPSYHMPRVSSVMRSTWDRGWSFIKKAGTVILLSSIIIWFTSNFSWSMKMVENYDGSILESIGSAFAWIFIPLGFGNAKAAIATVLGLVAKENIVATFGILYNFSGEISSSGTNIWSQLQADYTAAAGLSFLVFNLLCAPCFAAMSAIRTEMKSRKWTAFALTYQTVFAYLVSFCIYQIGSFATGVGNAIGITISVVIILVFVYLLFRKDKDKIAQLAR